MKKAASSSCVRVCQNANDADGVTENVTREMRSVASSACMHPRVQVMHICADTFLRGYKQI